MKKRSQTYLITCALQLVLFTTISIAIIGAHLGVRETLAVASIGLLGVYTLSILSWQRISSDHDSDLESKRSAMKLEVLAKLSERYEHALIDLSEGLEAEMGARYQQNMASRHALILGLAKLADYRDGDTGAHLERISEYSVLLAEQIRDQFSEIDDEWIERIHLAASLHDIGKVGIPDWILLKPGKLTDEERESIKKHPVIGADTLITVRQRLGDDDLVNMGIQIALGHHERWDGLGYPFGLSGDIVPLSARVVALADCYDALTSKRVYKDAFSHEEACRIIRKDKGKQFDPAMVDAFEVLHERFNEARKRLQPNNEAETQGTRGRMAA